MIEVRIAGLCRTDVYAATGLIPVDAGRVLGHEFGGVVREVGLEVSASWLEVSVAAFPWVGCGHCDDCQSNPLQIFCSRRQFLGIDLDGCFAQFVVLPVDRVFKLPTGCSYQAAAYAEPLAAALGVLRAPLESGQRIAVQGSNRIASLTRLVLTEIGGFQLTDTLESLDLLIETGLDEAATQQAFKALKPGGTLVMKSRPHSTIDWPLRLQVEKEIQTLALGYGSFQEALNYLAQRPRLFVPLWNRPTELDNWPELFSREQNGAEERKSFFCFEG